MQHTPHVKEPQTKTPPFPTHVAQFFLRHHALADGSPRRKTNLPPYTSTIDHLYTPRTLLTRTIILEHCYCISHAS